MDEARIAYEAQIASLERTCATSSKRTSVRFVGWAALPQSVRLAWAAAIAAVDLYRVQKAQAQEKPTP